MRAALRAVAMVRGVGTRLKAGRRDVGTMLEGGWNVCSIQKAGRDCATAGGAAGSRPTLQPERPATEGGERLAIAVRPQPTRARTHYIDNPCAIIHACHQRSKRFVSTAAQERFERNAKQLASRKCQRFHAALCQIQYWQLMHNSWAA